MGLLETASKIDTTRSRIPEWLPDLVHASACVEGYRTPFEVCEALVASELVTVLPKQELTFLLNMISTYMYVYDHRKDKVDIAFLSGVNASVGRDLIDGCGKLRTKPVFIGNTYINSEIPEYPEVIRDIERMSAIDNVVDRALAFFCYICKKQLFIDGNKRVAQVIANKILLDGNAGFLLRIPAGMNVTFSELLLEYYRTNDSYDLKEWLKRYAHFGI